MRDDSKQSSAAGRIRVTAFVDWNAQLHNAGAPNDNPLSRAKRTLEKTARAIGRYLAQHATDSPTEWALVLSEDDDVVPPIFTAEAWIQPHGGRAFILRASRPRAGFLKLDGLLMDMHA